MVELKSRAKLLREGKPVKHVRDSFGELVLRVMGKRPSDRPLYSIQVRDEVFAFDRIEAVFQAMNGE